MPKTQVSIDSRIYEKMKRVANIHGRRIPDQTSRALDAYLVKECKRLDLEYETIFPGL